MKNLIILMFLILFFSIGNIIYPNFPFELNLLLICLIFFLMFWSEVSILNKNFTSDYKFRSYRKKINYESILVAFIWTIILIYNNNVKKTIFFILLFWSISIINLIMFYLYQKKKPYTIFINKNELILNKPYLTKRNLTELNQIKFDRFSKCFHLSFETKSSVEIKSTEYNSADIQRLLEIMINKSDYEVEIPQNYQVKKNNSC